MRVKLKKLLLNGLMRLWKEIKIIALFFYPKYFWMVYICYVMLFLEGFLSTSNFNHDFIEFDLEKRPYITIDGLSYTVIMAVVMWLILMYRMMTMYRIKYRTLSLYACLHAMLIVLWAGTVATFGETVLWGWFR